MSIFQLQEGLVLQTNIELVTITCCSCGVPFAVPKRLRQEFMETKKSFYCPNGHSQSYTGTIVNNLKKQLEEKERELALKQMALDNERSDNLALRKNLTRTQNKLKKADGQLDRVKNGVCPCCNRTFQNLMQHMETQHPDYRPDTKN